MLLEKMQEATKRGDVEREALAQEWLERDGRHWAEKMLLPACVYGKRSMVLKWDPYETKYNREDVGHLAMRLLGKWLAEEGLTVSESTDDYTAILVSWEAK